MVMMPMILWAQNKPYNDASNPYYWKNRKPYAGYWQQDVAYTIKAQVDDQTDIVTGDEMLMYSNNSPDTLRFLYFHLYQNAFIKGSYLEQLNLANNFKQKFGLYEAAGKGTEIELLEATDNQVVSVQTDYSIMKVNLANPVLPGASVTLHIRFKTYFDAGGNQRRRMKTFKDDWGNKQYDGVHWYPRVCVYDRKFGWETDQHLGKEFYGDFGSFDVELTFPSHYIVDATGELQNRDEVLPPALREKLDVKNFKSKPLNEKPSVIITPDGTTKTWKFKSINTHDFAWVADPTFRIGEEVLTLPDGNKVSCISLAQEPHASGWQDAARFTSKVIEVYSRDIGAYAYPKMIVADARDGMEYPMLTLDNGLSPGYYGLLAHEVGHNWFFGMVGNNETYRACLDEGFTQFLTNWAMTAIFGEIKSSKQQPNPVSRMDQTVYTGYFRDAMKQQDPQLNTHSDDFGGALNHGGGYGHVYYKTATMLYNLQYVLGDTLFLQAMQHYFNQWKMCHPYIDDFRASIIQYTHTDLNWFFDQWMETTKRIDYTIGDVQVKNKIDTSLLHVQMMNSDDSYLQQLKQASDKQIVEVNFERNGEMQMPIDFTILTKDSQQFKYIIPNTYFVKSHAADVTVLPVWKGWGMLNPTYSAQVVLPKNVKVKDVIIDPSYRLADVNQLDNSLRFPVYASFDNFKRDAIDRKHYTLNWRPDVWFNTVDAIKVGLHADGHYAYYRHVFSSTFWYNMAAPDTYDGPARIPFNFTFKYRDGFTRNFYDRFEIRYLDGLSLLNFGLDYEQGDWLVELYFKGFYRNAPSHLDYLLYPNSWNAGMLNNTLNLDLTKRYNYRGGNGSVKYGLRTSVFSDYDYSRLSLQWINHHNLWSFEVHSRLFAQLMGGSKVAPESELNLAGANSEEMMDNKFIRSRGFVPENWLGYGADVNHFQAGGGLNVRGYAGYIVPVNTSGTQVQMYAGRNGVSTNLELDFDKWIPIHPAKLSKYIHFDTYLFGDIGVLQQQFAAGEYGLTKTIMATSQVMASAGAGTAFTVKRWSKYDEIKPFTIRFDVPLFLSSKPFVDGEYVKFRWVVAINRSF